MSSESKPIEAGKTHKKLSHKWLWLIVTVTAQWDLSGSSISWAASWKRATQGPRASTALTRLGYCSTGSGQGLAWWQWCDPLTVPDEMRWWSRTGVQPRQQTGLEARKRDPWYNHGWTGNIASHWGQLEFRLVVVLTMTLVQGPSGDLPGHSLCMTAQIRMLLGSRAEGA